MKHTCKEYAMDQIKQRQRIRPNTEGSAKANGSAMVTAAAVVPLLRQLKTRPRPRHLVLAGSETENGSETEKETNNFGLSPHP